MAKKDDLKTNTSKGEGRYLQTHNGSLFNELRSAVASPSCWKEDKVGITTDLTPNTRRIRASAHIGPDPGIEARLTDLQIAEWKARSLEWLLKIDCLNSDILDIACSVWGMRCNHPEATTIMRAEDFFRYRGLKPRGNSYWTDQKRQLAERIALLSSTWINLYDAEVIVNANGIRQKTKIQNIKSRALVVSSVAEEDHEVFAWKMRPGDVLMPFILSPSPQIAMLSRQILEWDPYRRSLEKKIGRYLMFLFRCRSSRSEWLKSIRVSSILNGIRQEIDPRYSARWRDRLENALDNLQAAGVIANWVYQEADETIVSQNPRWWHEYCDWKIIIEPTLEILSAYDSIKLPSHHAVKQKEKVASPLIEIISEMKRERLHRGLTQMQLAELLCGGISPLYVSMLERGVKSPSKKLTAAIKDWLGQKSFSQKF